MVAHLNYTDTTSITHTSCVASCMYLNLMNNGLPISFQKSSSFRLNEFTDDASTINDGRLFHALMTLWVKNNLRTFNLL